MAKKSSSKRTLKSLFSRSDASLHESAEKEEKKEEKKENNEGDKKKFRFPKFKTKSKSDAASEKSADGSQQVLREARNTAEDGDARADVPPENRRLSLYGTAPRSKDKEMSYSELDLRKPKRFATFSFNFMKKKKKDEDGLSKSSFGLHTQGIEEEEEEAPRGFGEMKLDQANAKRFSMSQPELDTSMKFDIPSPPPVANNQSESYFTLSDQSLSKSKEILINGFDIHEEAPVAPIATIPELQLDDPEVSEKENLPVADERGPMANKTDSDVVQHTEEESTHAVVTHPPSDAVNGAISRGSSSLTYLESNIKTAAAESTRDTPSLGADEAVTRPKVSLSHSKEAVLETAEGVASSTAMSDESTPPLSPEMVYGALYESLFPQNFTSEVSSSLLKSAPKIQREIIDLDTQTETVTVRTVEEVNYRRASTSYESDSTFRRLTDATDGSSSSGAAEVNVAEVKLPAAKKDFVMIKTFNERHTETNMIHPKDSASYQRESSDRRIADAFDFSSGDTVETSSTRKFTDIGQNETQKTATVETLSEIHREVRLISQDSDVNIRTTDVNRRDETTDASSSTVLDDVGLPEVKKGIMVKTRYEIETESNPASSRSSDYFVHTVSDAVDGFTSIDDESNEARLPPVHTEKTQVETHNDPIMIKTITEFNAEDNATRTDQSTTYYSRSVRTASEAVDDFADASASENGPDVKHSGTLKSPILIKTLNEIYTEANFIRPRKTSDESNASVQPAELAAGDLSSIDEKSADLTKFRRSETSDDPQMVETFETNINSRTSTFWESDSTASTVKDAIDCFDSSETSSPPILTEVSRVETLNEPVLIKTITELNTDDGAASSHLSTVTTVNDASGHFSSLSDRISDVSAPEIPPETKKLTILVKTRNETQTETDFTRLPETSSDEFASTVRKTEVSVDETGERPETLIVTPSEADSPSRMSDIVDSDFSVQMVKETIAGFESLGEQTVEANPAQLDEEKIIVETQNKTVVTQTTTEIRSEADLGPSQERKSDTAVDSVDGFASVAEKTTRTLTELKTAETNDKNVVVELPDEVHLESSSGKLTSEASDSTIRRARDTISSFVSSQLRRSPETRLRNLPSSNSSIPPSEMSLSYSEVKSDNGGLVPDTSRSAPLCQPAAPPIPDCATSRGTGARVTGSQQSAVPVAQTLADGPGARGRSPAPPPVNATVLKIRTQSLSDRPGRMEGTDRADGALSPSYLSIGSDDGSAMDVYYSAEEGNAEESGDEIFAAEPREERVVATGDGDAELHENLTRQTENTGSVTNWRDEGGKEVVEVKVMQEGGDKSKTEDGQQQLNGQKLENGQTEVPELLVSTAVKSLEGDDATAAQQTKVARREEEEEEVEVRKEDVPATPVQPVNNLMVCDVAPPSSEPHSQGEGSKANWTVRMGTEDHTTDEQRLAGLEGLHLADKSVDGADDVPAAPGSASELAVITPVINVTEKHDSPHADEGDEVIKESTGTFSITLTSSIRDTSAAAGAAAGNVTQRAELQSDATQIEHNRTAPSSEWAGPITQSLDRKVEEQVAVASSEPNEDARRPDPRAAEVACESHQRPAEDQPDLSEGIPTPSQTSTVAAEDSGPESDPDSADKMNSGYSSLSTKLTFKTSSVPKEDESKLRFHKVSLIKEDDGGDTQEKTSVSETESNGPTFSSESKWRNRFEGVSQFVPKKTESFSSDSLSYRVSDSSYSNYPLSSSSSSSSSYSSTLPEAIADKHLSNALSTTTTSSSSSSSFSSSSPPSSEEHGTLSSRLSDRTVVYLRRESEPAEQPKEEWRRSLLLEREEPAAPAGEAELRREAEREGEPERTKSLWDSQQLPPSHFASARPSGYDQADGPKGDDEASEFTGVFKATLVDLVPEPAAPPSTPPDDDSPSQFDMETLVDTLKSMRPPMRPRGGVLRPQPPTLMSSLPPIVEDAASPVATDVLDTSSLLSRRVGMMSPPQETNGLYTLPADLGLGRNSRDSRSPLELMKQGQDPQGARNLTLPLRASTTSSIVMRKSSDSSPEELLSPVQNGNGQPSTSRLESSVIFASYRSSSVDQPLENGKAHRPLFRTASLPDTRPSNNRMSSGPKELGDPSAGADQVGPRSERLSFLLNNLVPSTGSLPGMDDSNGRISRPPSFGVTSQPATNSPTSVLSPQRVLSPTGSIDLQRPGSNADAPFSMFGQTPGMGVGTSPLSTPILQRSFSSESPPILQRSFSNEGLAGVQTSMFGNVQGGSQFQSQEPDRNIMSKYRAFPDAYLTKEKEHGKLNPRPGKMYIFDQPGMCGQRIEIRSDVVDATPWELQETISIRVVRGGWVLYEKPNFKGEKIALDEGDIEITYPFAPPEEQQQQQQQQNGQKEGGEQNGQKSEEQTESKPPRRFIIGSIRRAVRDYSVPEISLFPEENAEGKKVIFRDTSDDARIFGFPIKANSIIINAGLWLVYAQPFFQGVPRVLEVGGYTNPAAWGVEQPYVGSLHPLKVGEPRVENLTEPKVVIFDKPYFTGKSRTITSNKRDFMSRTDPQQSAFMYSVGSMKVLGGIWVGYEKEGFRGNQYLLEEGEYHDWRVWGATNAELRSIRVIRADLSDPLMVMFEQPEEDQEGMQEENTFEVTEAIPDVELFEYKTSTRSIHVLSGAWIAYSHVDFSGSQYILEKGFYNNCADWGSQDNRICSVQPILLAPSDGSRGANEIALYSEPDFRGQCHVFNTNQGALPDKFLTKSCRVAGGSWVLHDDKQHSGSMFVLSEGDYPSLTSMGCPQGCTIRSAKVVPLMFSVPSISLFGLECLEGREITVDTEMVSLLEEGFNNDILSIRVNTGCWVICEHSNFRGRQFLLEPIEITNWPKFSSLTTIGSMYPVRQKRHFFRVKNKESGNYLSVQGGVEEMKSGRVVAAPQVEPMSEIWFYQDGLLKNKLSMNMALQVMGNIEPAAKVVLWSETRQPIQTWTAQMSGLITSVTFPGFVLDVKGGKSYDKDHVVIMPDSEERPSQQWLVELL